MKSYTRMNRAELDAAYNNTAAVPDFPGVLADFQARSSRLYASRPVRRDLAYGESPRQRFDWIPCGEPDAPCLVFIHGGYWQNCSKEDFAFIAEGPLNDGFNVVLAEYTLAPQASMTQIVAEIGCLLEHLAADPEQLGVASRPLILSGHSAGGHLTLMYRDHPLVTAALAISSLVDLEPISLSWLNDKLRLSPQEIEAFSPLRRLGKGVPTVLAVGADELPELVRHTDEYAAASVAEGEPATLLHVPGCTHFSVLDDLARAEGRLLQALSAIIPR
ncbi:esterase [Pseudomonas aeruginosa]|uniref:alpha/beta hydrolase n=1 Tax=Pseudomonas aeruginosa TaxID=287 RepID=UPI0007176736|nr:alpha/beta hydrolase [Pseudomonas aeruginosa]KRU93984.1 esterase [Pseudomonas aeruginosa]KRU98999.1 esterase [Pseudomonas aeruginosa]MCT2412447.1 alpha/beta hydrolase [Pseudomonas aeruginosa]RIZ51911.1 esterase [Pseudomonas aeruginosa]SQC95718.1 putative esterase/lipase [Pseudomonas aeruginosa]